MSVEVHWRELGEIGEDEGWKSLNCLYAYITVERNEILYLGKARGKTVCQRLNASDKNNLWNCIKKQRGISEYIVLLGELYIEIGRRSSHELLIDVESLLIAREQPWGNIQCRDTRISRPNLKVKCIGDWIGKSKIYLDS